MLVVMEHGDAADVGLYSRGGDDDLSVDELLVELGVLALLVGGGDEGVALVLEPLADAELVLGGAQKAGDLCGFEVSPEAPGMGAMHPAFGSFGGSLPRVGAECRCISDRPPSPAPPVIPALALCRRDILLEITAGHSSTRAIIVTFLGGEGAGVSDAIVGIWGNRK